MEPIGYDELERSKDRINRLRGALSRELLRSASFRILQVFPEATRIHVVMYPDNVYRVWAVTAGRRWVAVCEDDVAPTWSSINLDNDIDLIIRLTWDKRIRTYIRRDGVEVHSVKLEANYTRYKRQGNGRAPASHVDEGEAPSAQDGGPSEGRHQRHLEEAGAPILQHQDGTQGDQPGEGYGP